VSSVEELLKTSVRIKKLPQRLSNDAFNKWWNAVKRLGAERKGGMYDYEFEVTGGHLLSLLARGDADRVFEEILEGIRAGSDLETVVKLKNLYESLRNAVQPGVVEVLPEGFYATMWGHPQTLDLIEERMKRDQREGGFVIRKRRYNPDRRRYEDVIIPMYRRLNPAILRVPRGTLPRLQRILDELGLRHNIASLRYTNLIDQSLITVPLRDYQTAAVLQALDQLSRIGAATIMAATGAGKTEMGIAIIQAVKPSEEQPAVVVVPSKDLALQWYERIQRYGGGLKPALVTGDRVEYPSDANVIVTTYATPYTAVKEVGLREVVKSIPDLQRELPEFERMLAEVEKLEEEEEEGGEEAPKDTQKKLKVVNALLQSKIVVFDEAHHLPARTVKLLSRLAPHAMKLGLSATPWRNDDLDLVIYAHTGEIASRVSSTDLISRGYLVSPVIFTLNTGISGNYGTYSTEKSEVLRNPERVRLAVEVVRRLPKPLLVLTQEKGPGELVAKALKAEGINAEFVHGELSTQERERILKDVKEGRIEVIVATTLADEGLDLPNLKSLLLYFPGKSSTRVYQRIGRALRPYEDKPVAFVVDMVDQTRYFNEHAAARKRMYQTEGGWRIIEAQTLEDFDQKLQAVMSEAGMALENRRRESEDRERELTQKGWVRVSRPIAVVGPTVPEMKPPVFYKSWGFGPYQIHAYRSRDTDEAVWVHKRVKPVKVAA